MKKDIICVLIPALFLVGLALGAYKLYQGSLIMADNSCITEIINTLISEIGEGKKQFSQEKVVHFLGRLRELEQGSSEAWRSQAKAIKYQIIVCAALSLFLLGLFVERIIAMRK